MPQAEKVLTAIGELHNAAGQELLKMWRVTVPPGKRVFYQHSHTRFEITVVDAGSGRYMTPSGVFDMQPGDVFVFASNEPHFIAEVGEDGLSITNLHFEPRYLTDGGEEGGIPQYPDFCFSHAPDFKNRIPAGKAGVLREVLYHIAAELTDTPVGYTLSVRAMLHLMLIDLIRTHGYAALTPPGVQFSGMLQAMAYIDAHFCEAITLPDIAAAAGLTPNYFSALFKQLNSVTLWDYITAKRVEKAVGLIVSPDFDGTMLAIALACGFNNTANFNKAFRKHTGMTPSQYKKTDSKEFLL